MSLHNYLKFANNIPMLAHIATRNNDLPVEKVAKALKTLKLPIPREHEYFVTSDLGYLAFMSPLGCTFRISNNNKCPRIIHPRIIQPLKRIDLNEEFRLDIFPGLKHTRSILTSARLSHILDRDRVNFYDDAVRNCGAIPRKALKSIFNYSVVCDAGAFRHLRNYNDAIFPPLYVSNDNQPDPQTRAYQHLCAAFEKGDIKAAWKLCAENKKEGILLSEWDKTAPLFLPELRAIAEKYSARLKRLTI